MDALGWLGIIVGAWLLGVAGLWFLVGLLLVGPSGFEDRADDDPRQQPDSGSDRKVVHRDPDRGADGEPDRDAGSDPASARILLPFRFVSGVHGIDATARSR
jgi:hypothetical protein